MFFFHFVFSIWMLGIGLVCLWVPEKGMIEKLPQAD